MDQPGDVDSDESPIEKKNMLVSEVADRLNFPSQSAFGYFFKRETGMTPTEYQKAD